MDVNLITYLRNGEGAEVMVSTVPAGEGIYESRIFVQREHVPGSTQLFCNKAAKALDAHKGPVRMLERNGYAQIMKHASLQGIMEINIG